MTVRPYINVIDPPLVKWVWPAIYRYSRIGNLLPLTNGVGRAGYADTYRKALADGHGD